jgi:hypothetical protein
MYLVHARLTSNRPGSLPVEVGAWLRADPQGYERLEHVAIHRRAGADRTLGLYLLADTLEQAESVAATLVRGTLARRPELDGWELAAVGAPLVTPFYELLASTGEPAPGPGPGRPEAASRRPSGRKGPGPDPSSGKPFQGG